MPDPASLIELGLVGLFVAAFLAGSILPFASEAVLVGVLMLGASAGAAVSVATLGNVLGALTLYAMGRLVTARRDRPPGPADRLLSRLVGTEPAGLERAEERLRRFGPVALLAAWVPVLGDALVLAAGLFALPIAPVTSYIALGKAARYLALAGAVAAAN